jgi:hypothetical protein
VKVVEEYLRKVVSAQKREWDERLPIVLLACTESTHKSAVATSASMVFGRELRLPCDLLFGVTANKEHSTTDKVVDLIY